MSLVHCPHRLHHHGKWPSRSHWNLINYSSYPKSSKEGPTNIHLYLLAFVILNFTSITFYTLDVIRGRGMMKGRQFFTISALTSPTLHFKISQTSSFWNTMTIHGHQYPHQSCFPRRTCTRIAVKELIKHWLCTYLSQNIYRMAYLS